MFKLPIWGDSGAVAVVGVVRELVEPEKRFSRLPHRAPEPLDERPVRTGRKPAGGQRHVVQKPTPERPVSGVARAAYRLERGPKRYRQPASATLASERTRRR